MSSHEPLAAERRNTVKTRTAEEIRRLTRYMTNIYLEIILYSTFSCYGVTSSSSVYVFCRWMEEYGYLDEPAHSGESQEIRFRNAIKKVQRYANITVSGEHSLTV